MRYCPSHRSLLVMQRNRQKLSTRIKLVCSIMRAEGDNKKLTQGHLNEGSCEALIQPAGKWGYTKRFKQTHYFNLF